MGWVGLELRTPQEACPHPVGLCQVWALGAAEDPKASDVCACECTCTCMRKDVFTGGCVIPCVGL